MIEWVIYTYYWTLLALMILPLEILHWTRKLGRWLDRWR